MICALIKNVIDLYLKEKLIGFQARWIKAHISGCAACAKEEASWNHLFNELRNFSTAPAPTDLKSSLKKALTATLPRQPLSSPGDWSNGWNLAQTPALSMAFGLIAFALSISVSIFGSGVPSQLCTDGPDSVCIAPFASTATIVVH